MPVTRKTRILSLRLSEQEFESLRTLYAAHGVKSVSEFVRAAIERVISQPPQDRYPLEMRVEEMDGRLHVLDGEVSRLAALLDQQRTQRQNGD